MEDGQLTELESYLLGKFYEWKGNADKSVWGIDGIYILDEQDDTILIQYYMQGVNSAMGSRGLVISGEGGPNTNPYHGQATLAGFVHMAGYNFQQEFPQS